MSAIDNLNDEYLIDNPVDKNYSKPKYSRLLFLVFFFSLFIFSWAGCYRLHQSSYKSNADIKVPESSLYEPKYK